MRGLAMLLAGAVLTSLLAAAPSSRRSMKHMPSRHPHVPRTRVVHRLMAMQTGWVSEPHDPRQSRPSGDFETRH
jgi:hypothetical protein